MLKNKKPGARLGLLSRSLALIMLVMSSAALFASCDGTGSPSDSTDTGAPKTVFDLNEYTLIRPEYLSSTLLKKIVAFRTNLSEATNSQIAISEDWVKGGITDEVIAAKEILVGRTNRPQSAEAIESLPDPTCYVIKVSGNKIVINSASDSAIERAIDHFMTLVSGGQLALEENFLYTSEAIPSLQIALNGKSDYKVVYKDGLDSSTSSTNEKDRTDVDVLYCKEIKAKIEKLTGAQIGITTDWVKKGTDTSALPEILVGDTDRPETAEFMNSLSPDEYGFAVIGKKVVVNGHNLTTLELAYNSFMSYIDSAASSGADGTRGLAILEGTRITDSVGGWYTDFPEFEGGEYGGCMDAHDSCLQFLYTGVSLDDYRKYCTKLESAGFTEYMSNDIVGNLSAAYLGKDGMIYVYYVPADNAVRIITSPSSENTYPAYPTSASQPAYQRVTPSKITAMNLNYSEGNFGMCYIVTLADGSFIVFDGGGYNASYGDDGRLYRLLKELNKRPDGKIVIAGWFLTHEHWDHFTNFFNMIKNHGSEIKIEACYMNMPSKVFVYNSNNPNYYVDNNFQALSSYVGGTVKVKLHTGMKFYIRNAEIEILFTQEDVFPDRCNYFNETTTVLRMNIDGNSIMWTGDAKNWASKGITRRYGDYVKSDICQVAHHGYDGLNQAFYNTVNPKVLLWPTSKGNVANQVKGTTYAVDKLIYEKVGADNVIISEPTQTITLPLSLPFVKGVNRFENEN